MMTEQINKIKTHAEDTLYNLDPIDPDKMTRDQFLLYGASMAILNAHNGDDTTIIEAGQGVDFPEKIKSQKPKRHISYKNPDIEYYFERVQSELNDSEGYYQKYIETNDANYVNLLQQENQHANIFINKLQSMPLSTDEKAELNEYIRQRDELLRKVATPLQHRR